MVIIPISIAVPVLCLLVVAVAGLIIVIRGR